MSKLGLAGLDYLEASDTDYEIRALFQKPKILMHEEAVSALDGYKEKGKN